MNKRRNMHWSKDVFFRIAFVFSLLFMLTFPFELEHVVNVFALLGNYIFEPLISWSAKVVFNIKQPYTKQILSDSTGLYIHIFHLLVISVVVGLVWQFVKQKEVTKAMKYWFSVVVAYYLALFLFVYGLNKVFKWQFYLPEPNTLFTTVGNTPLDLLFWSTMGASYPYTVFSGVMEVIPACLLLFKRTRLVGAIIAFGVLVNVVLINFSFDISVKVFSLFLLFLSVLLIVPYIKQLYWFFLFKQSLSLERWQPVYGKYFNTYLVAKTVIIVFVLFEVLNPYYTANNYNDDVRERPPLHGAYSTNLFVKNGDTLAPMLTNRNYIKKIFVHRRGYFITQTIDDRTQDYKLLYSGNTLKLNNYYQNKDSELSYLITQDSTYQFSGVIDSDSVIIEANKINLEQQPLLQKEFNWTIDGY